jgi:signal transduction histidine kinase
MSEASSPSTQVASSEETPADQSDQLDGKRAGLTRAQRIWLVSISLATVAFGLLALSRDLQPPLQRPTVPWWALTIGFGLAEVFVIHLRFDRHAHSFSLSEIPLVVGLALATPVATATAQAIGAGVALAAHRRQKPIRIAFNISQRALTTMCSILVFHEVVQWLGSSWPALWAAGIAATLLADLLAGLLINLAISLSESTRLTLDEVAGIGTALTFANTALALVTVMVMSEHPAGLLLVMVPAAATFLAGSAYAAVQRKHDNLMSLYASTRLAQGSLDLPTMLPAILEHARGMFHAEIAEVILLSETGQGPHLRTILDRDDAEVLQPVDLNPLKGVWARVASEREGILLPRPISNGRLAEYFASRGIRDAIVVPLAADDGLLGAMLIGNRAGDFSTFDEEDLKLLETLGNHFAVALRNARLVRRLEEALDHETEMNKMKSDFVATVSHELRTPLTNVQGYIKTLLRADLELPSTEQREFLERADLHSERLRRLIEDLLFASRVEASRPMSLNDRLNAANLIERVVQDRDPTLEDARFVLEFDPRLPTIQTSEEQVFRILSNLVDNAIKYSPAEAPITVTARRHDEGVLFSVLDQGEGIPREEQDRIFERFYQVDNSSTRRVGGAGMGLYICRKAAEVLGGRVWLERSDANGSVFCLWLPLDPVNDVTIHIAS